MSRKPMSTTVKASLSILLALVYINNKPAFADEPSAEMKALVRQSSGASAIPSESAGKAPKKPTIGETAGDTAAIYIQAGADKEQSEKIRELRRDFAKFSSDKANEVMALFRQMRTLTMQTSLDETKILSVQEQINSLQANVAMEKTKTLIKIRKILTPKQRENLVELMKKRSQSQTQMLPQSSQPTNKNTN